MGWFTLNSDGAAKGCPGLAGEGGIVRDHRGFFQTAYSIKLGVCTAFRAEIRAVAYGIDCAWRIGIRKLIVQIDSLSGILALKSMEPYGGVCVHIINHCRTLLNKQEWEVVLVHCYREGNRAADWLANKGVGQANKVDVIEDPPPELRRIIAEDIRGVELPPLLIVVYCFFFFCWFINFLFFASVSLSFHMHQKKDGLIPQKP